MKYIEENLGEEVDKTALGSSGTKTVHWAATVKDNEMKSEKLLIATKNEVREYIIKQFKDKKHEEFKKELLDNYTPDQRVKILSVEEYSPLEWACVHGDIEALKLIKDTIPTGFFKKMVYHNCYQPFRLFLIKQEDAEKDPTPYNRQARIDGIKIFYRINNTAVTETMGNFKYVTENIRKDFQTAVESINQEESLQEKDHTNIDISPTLTTVVHSSNVSLVKNQK